MGRLFDIQQFKLINKYALRDFSRSYKKLWVVTSTLFVSLLLLSLTFSIKEALNSEIENNSKELLGGDIQVDSDIDPLPTRFLRSSMILERSALQLSLRPCYPRKGESPVFTELRAVDNNYPLYGEIETTSSGSITENIF